MNRWIVWYVIVQEDITTLLESIYNGLSAGGEATEGEACGRGNPVTAADIEGPTQFLAC